MSALLPSLLLVSSAWWACSAGAVRPNDAQAVAATERGLSTGPAQLGRVVREVTRLADGTERWVKIGYGPDGHPLRGSVERRSPPPHRA